MPVSACRSPLRAGARSANNTHSTSKSTSASGTAKSNHCAKLISGALGNKISVILRKATLGRCTDQGGGTADARAIGHGQEPGDALATEVRAIGAFFEAHTTDSAIGTIIIVVAY